MPITVREMWQLEEFRVFRLVAGERGWTIKSAT